MQFNDRHEKEAFFEAVKWLIKGVSPDFTIEIKDLRPTLRERAIAAYESPSEAIIQRVCNASPYWGGRHAWKAPRYLFFLPPKCARCGLKKAAKPK